ncbi:restriction endonuclease subunit S [Yersinia enterocolitica]
MTLLTENWKEFFYEDIFDIKKGKRLTKANMTNGLTPFIGAIDSNNGVSAYIGQMPIHKANTITVSYNGSVAEAFYQSEPFWASDDINVLYPKFELTNKIAFFLCAIIKKEKYRFNYGRKWHLNRMKKSTIKLPVNELGLPDWNWIESFVDSLNIPLSIDVNAAKEDGGSLPLSFEKWKEFTYSDLFSIERGRGPRKKNLDGAGSTPFITSTDKNNGLTNFTSMSAIHPGNVITVNRNGSVGEAFYQETPFCSTEDVHVFIPKFELDVYIAMFLITLIKKEKYRFGYGRKWGLERMRNSKIKLPVLESNTPDWNFMRIFIKRLPYTSQI